MSPIFLCICLPCIFTCKFLTGEFFLVFFFFFFFSQEPYISCSLWCLCAELHVLWSYLKTPSTFCSQKAQISKACLDPSVLWVWWEKKKENNINKIKAVAWAVTHSWNDGCFILLFFVYGRSNQSVSVSSCCTLVSLEQHKWPSFVVVVCSEACTVCQPILLSAHTQILSALWNRRARN